MKERWRIRERNHARTHTLDNVNNFRHQFRTAKEFSMIDRGNGQSSSRKFNRFPFLQSEFRQWISNKMPSSNRIYRIRQLDDR